MIHARPGGLSLRTILIGGAIVVVFFAGTLLALNTFFPDSTLSDKRPALAALPPLQPVTRTSYVIAPVAVAAHAIRDAMDAAAPRSLTGRRDNPLSEILGKADIGWTISRGPLAVAGGPAGLTISTPLNGTLRATGQIANQAGNLTGAITGLVGGDIGRNIGGLTTRVLDQRADIRGTAVVTSRPALQPNWRIEPNLTGHVSIADGGMTIAGIKLNVAGEVKPLLDRTINDQMASLQSRLRNDPTLELTARREWAKMCRSIPLGAAGAGAPNLWLEVRPIRAAAASPRIEPAWVVLTVGVQAETRIVPSETKPNCPFPDRLDIVSQLDQGKVGIAVPIDVPFIELNRVLEAQLKGKTFPDDPNSPAAVTINRAVVSASGERLLISLRVKAREQKSWFGFGAEATVHVWGKPTLDREQQILRLTDITLDVNSEAAFGLLGTAARAAIPYVQSAIAENAVVDLKPFAASARRSIETAIGDFQKQADGVTADAAVTGLRLAGIEFDSTTLRVIAEAEGTVRVTVTKIAAP
jgi:hypothetical protein